MKREPPKTKQNAVVKSMATFTRSGTAVAQVLATYSDRVTCDVRLLEGLELRNVPVGTDCGVIEIGGEKKVYGKIELPIVRNYVMILFIGGRPMIIGNTFPFLNELFLEEKQLLAGPNDITGPEMERKEYTTKLLEKDKPKTYKRVFPSGTTLEIDDDGSVFLETIDLGRFVHKIDPNDPNNSFVEWTSARTDADLFSRIKMQATENGILIEDTVNDNTIKLNSCLLYTSPSQRDS